MTSSQNPQSKIDAYLRKMADALGPLPPAELADILREIRGHIEERIALAGGADDRTVEQVLTQMGEPQDIGSFYRTDALVAQARATFSPLLVLTTTLRVARRTTLGLGAFLLGFFGYAVGVALLTCAALKPFFPRNIGLFVGPHGVNLGLIPAPDTGVELLGWWVIPVDLVLSVLALVGTTAFLRWMLRFARPSRDAGTGTAQGPHPATTTGFIACILVLIVFALLACLLVVGRPAGPPGFQSAPQHLRDRGMAGLH